MKSWLSGKTPAGPPRQRVAISPFFLTFPHGKASGFIAITNEHPPRPGHRATAWFLARIVIIAPCSQLLVILGLAMSLIFSTKLWQYASRLLKNYLDTNFPHNFMRPRLILYSEPISSVFHLFYIDFMFDLTNIFEELLCVKNCDPKLYKCSDPF